MIFISNKRKFYISLLVAIIMVEAAFVVHRVLYQIALDGKTGNSASVTEKVHSPPTPDEEMAYKKRIAEIIKEKDINKCERITDETYRTICKNNVALVIAKESGDVSYCQKLDNKLASVFDCQQSIVYSKINRGEGIESCRSNPNSQEEKKCEDSYWIKQATDKNDNRLCQNVSDERNKNDCLDYLTVKNILTSKNNLVKADCQKLNGSGTKKDCLIYTESQNNKTQIICTIYQSNTFKSLLCNNN